jgi:predicted  nucleic acid-binding Zn-ribbon protein
MLIRISLIVAIIAGLAVGTLNFVKVKKIIEETRAQRDDWHNKFTTTDAALTKTKKDLVATTAQLDQTKTNLATTKKELATAQNSIADLKKQMATLQDNLANTEKELTDAKILVEQYKAAFPTPQQALSVAKDMKALQDRMDVVEDEKKVLQRQLTRVQNELANFKDPGHHVELPATLVGKVLVTDPKWDFVVLNIGEEQGVLNNGELLVSREGKLVAKVKITSVQKDRCIANILPGSLGEVLEGDKVIPAFPAQS